MSAHEQPNSWVKKQQLHSSGHLARNAVRSLITYAGHETDNLRWCVAPIGVGLLQGETKGVEIIVIGETWCWCVDISAILSTVKVKFTL